ncbi:MAG: VWA domain-containing protein [Phycisphaera sp.]|nr:VWA domain-containing protein [Phycisphaera sp.]
MLTLAAFPGFLVPGLAVAGALAVSIPIIIHILSRRPRKPEPWAAMRFLLAAYKKHRVRTQLEQWLLLASRCLLMLVIGMALAGLIWSASGSLGQITDQGRTVYVVLDNSITATAKDASGQQRWVRLTKAANTLLDTLGAKDRVALITASRPVQTAVWPPSADPMAVRRQIEQMRPTAAEADLPEALRQTLRSIEQDDKDTRPVYVVMLSDLSAGAAPVGEPMPAELKRLGEKATLMALEPATSSNNVQITKLEPDRRIVVPEIAGATPTVTWTVGVRRLTDNAAGATLSTVRLQSPDRAPIVRAVQWEPGQTETQVRITTPLDKPGLQTVSATLDPEGEATDSVGADNTRQSVVRVYEKLVVLVLDRKGAETQAADGFTPRKWLTTVLAPAADRLNWPIEVREQDAGTVSDETLTEASVAFVLRPDLLSDTAWASMKQWCEAGGLVWFVAPATPQPGLWPQTLTDTFGLSWSIALEPTTHDPPLKLEATETPAPELARLRPDLADLLRPVTVSRRLPIDAASLGAATDVMLSANGSPLLIATTAPPHGRVMLLATALDSEWTNLPTKPLFVPLVHESLRAAIDRLLPGNEFEPGDQPQLAASWSGTTRLDGPEGADMMLAPVDSADPQRGVQPIRPFAEPGLYRSETDALVVNVDPNAANTLAVDRNVLTAWLDGAGTWKNINADDPTAPMRAESARTDWTTTLLWMAIVLALIEMFLARHVSHATAHKSRASALTIQPTN